MQQNKTVTSLDEYNVEEGDDLKITTPFNFKTRVFMVVLFGSPIVATGWLIIDLHINPTETFIKDLIVCTLGFFFFVWILIEAVKCDINSSKYSLLINEEGIRNVVYNGEVFIPWDKIVSYGKETVLLNGYRRRIHDIVYFSTEEIDHNSIQKNVNSPLSRFYQNSSELIIIVLRLGECNDWLAEDEKNMLYEKIDSYVKRHKTEP